MNESSRSVNGDFLSGRERTQEAMLEKYGYQEMIKLSIGPVWPKNSALP
jgi:hypothetical protein